jgi:hypothetical protein
VALPLAEPSPRRDPGVLVAGYEALREAVAGSGHGWRHGHGVLAGRGVAAWITAWTAPVPVGAGTTAQPSHPLLSSRSATCETAKVLSSSPHAGEVVAVLAQMTLAHL